MTIEDALSKIELDDKNEKPKDDVPTASNIQELILESQKSLGGYLVKTLQDRMDDFPGGGVVNFLETWGPFVIRPKPFITNNKTCASSIDLVDELDVDILSCVLRELSGGYFSGTDIKPGGSIKMREEGAIYIPEITSMKEILFGHTIVHNVASVHPFLLVLGMDPKFRPLMTLALNEAIKSKEMKIVKNDDYAKILSTLLSYAPSMRSIMEVAKKYGITNLKDAMIDLKGVVEMYVNNWKTQ